MTGTIIEFILLLVSHAAAGIFSSTLKYTKKTTYIIWGTWIALQTALLLYSELVLTNWTLQFFVGFILSLVGQYVIFFVTTRGKLAQRVFTILTVYERRAKENRISVKITAEGSRELSVLPQDLVVVIANLFENAINATAKLKNKDKFIDIRIKENSKRLVIKVENPCKTNYTFDESGFGVGIRSVIATTNKYEGMYDFTAEDGMFSAKIILNLK